MSHPNGSTQEAHQLPAESVGQQDLAQGTTPGLPSSEEEAHVPRGPHQQYEQQQQQHEEAVHHAPPPNEQGHHYEQQLLYAQQDPAHHHLQHLHHAEYKEEMEDAAGHHDPSAQSLPPGHPQEGHLQHEEHLQPHSAGIAMTHATSFAQQLMDPHMSQQQLAQYHQQMAHFHPQAYQQQLVSQYHQGQLQDAAPLYFPQGIPASQLQQAYQDAAGGVQDSIKPEISNIDEAAAVHLTALRNPIRPDGQLGDQGQAVGMGHQPPMGHHPQMQPGMTDGGVPGTLRDAAYAQPTPQALLGATTGRASSKRKAWRASHEGEGTEPGDPNSDGSRGRRKQTRRPDRLCHHEGCFVTPTYNYPNEKKRIFCVTHKLEGMVNVVAKRCAHPDCNVNPRFHYEGNTRGLYCSEHKLEGMINVIDRRCQEPECKKFPSHNYPGSHKKLFCATHKKEGMVDMSHGSN